MMDSALNDKYYHLLLTHLCPTLLEFDFENSTTATKVISSIHSRTNADINK
jgi:hypothetical protein